MSHAAMPADLQPRLALAIEAAREAGRITLEYFRRDDLDVELKHDDTPVTAADRRAEEHLAATHRRGLSRTTASSARNCPSSRARAASAGSSIPIDGTKSFIHGVPLYSTLVGVECEGQSVLGVIRIPALDECVYAARGLGAWYLHADQPPRRAQVSVDADALEGACSSPAR